MPFLPNWLEMLHKPMLKSIIGNKNGTWMTGSNWSGMKPGAVKGWLFIELVKDEHKNIIPLANK